MRKTKQDWLEEGLKTLGENGMQALKIDLLTVRLGVTKGSFYHHFKNHQDFKESLLNFIEEQGTLEIINLTEAQGTPEQKFEYLGKVTLGYSPETETALRVWALHDEAAWRYQARIDQLRLNYLKTLCTSLLDDEKKGSMMAQMLHAIYVGCQQLIPPVEGEALEKLYREVQRLYRVT